MSLSRERSFTLSAMRNFRFENFVRDGQGAKLRSTDDNSISIFAVNVPGPLAFVQYVLEDENDDSKLKNTFVKDIIIPDEIDVKFLERGLKVYRHVNVSFKVFQSFVSKFVRCLRKRIAAPIKVTRNTVEKLCDLADTIQTNDKTLKEAKNITKILLRQMLPEKTDKLKMILKFCPTRKMGRYAKRSKNDLDWNPDLRNISGPFNFVSVLSGDLKPRNDVEKLAFEFLSSMKTTEKLFTRRITDFRNIGDHNDGLLAVVRNETNTRALNLLENQGRIGAFECLDQRWCATPNLVSKIFRVLMISETWNTFPVIDDWNKFLRGRRDLVESCLVLCQNETTFEELRILLPKLNSAHTTCSASIALAQLPFRQVTLILYCLDQWSFYDLFRFLPVLENNNIKEVVSTFGSNVVNCTSKSTGNLYLTSNILTVLRARYGGSSSSSINFIEHTR